MQSQKRRISSNGEDSYDLAGKRRCRQIDDCSNLAQYKLAKGQTPLCIDTDPVNATFHGYKAIPVQQLNIIEGDEIRTRNFDTIIELIDGSKDDVIIDNGASSFVPLSHYLISNKVPELLKEMGHELIIHTVITGGQALLGHHERIFSIGEPVSGTGSICRLAESLLGADKARREVF